jgi:hypothetical protein
MSGGGCWELPPLFFPVTPPDASMTSWLDHLPSGNQKQFWRNPSDGKDVSKLVSL